MVPSGPPLPANSGFGRRIVYSNAQQRIWLVEANEQVSHSFLVSGRHGLPAVGTYHVFAKIAMEPDGSLMLPWTLKFDPLRAAASSNLHGIPLDGERHTPIQDDALLGTPAVARLPAHGPVGGEARLRLVGASAPPSSSRTSATHGRPRRAGFRSLV